MQLGRELLSMEQFSVQMRAQMQGCNVNKGHTQRYAVVVPSSLDGQCSRQPRPFNTEQSQGRALKPVVVCVLR